MNHPLIVILGTTAVGKTALACQLAKRIDGEIISADSRQVFKGMDLGTGKDYSEYNLSSGHIPYYLIDIKEAGEEYSVFEFQEDFLRCIENIRQRDKFAILCGGTGLYLEAALSEYKMTKVPLNSILRNQMDLLSTDQLIALLRQKKKLHNTTDTIDRSRLYRAIEIADFEKLHPKEKLPKINRLVFGVKANRELVKAKIHYRLKERIEQGLIEEVEGLIALGITHQKLRYYGLEYKYVSLYLKGEIDKNQLFEELYKAISAFAKRQMTWFRRMEKKGTIIHWVNAEDTMEEKLGVIMEKLKLNEKI